MGPRSFWALTVVALSACSRSSPDQATTTAPESRASRVREDSPSLVASQRLAILRSHPSDYGISNPGKVWAVVVEVGGGFGKSNSTTTSLVDGYTWYFFTDGRGRFPRRGEEPPAANEASRKLCTVAVEFLSKTIPTTEFPGPKQGFWQFFIMTPEGVRYATASEDSLMNGHELGKLFYAAFDVRDAWIQWSKGAGQASE